MTSSPSSLQGKRIALTGAASGIGRAVSLLLATRGAVLSLADLNTSGLAETLSLLPKPASGTHLTTTLDVRSSSDVNAWLSATVAHLGGLDALANIAGVCAHSTPLADETDETWDLVMNVNARGTFNCMRAALRHLTSGGCIVNTASIAGLRGLQGMSIYTASKHAVVGMTKAVAKEVGERGIRVNAVAPGATDTPMLSKIDEERGGGMSFEGLPLRRKGSPEEVARVFAFLVGDEASFVTGSVYSVDAGECA